MRSILTFLAFSLLIKIFVFLTFTFNPFDSNASFQGSSLPSRSSSVSVINAKSSAYSSSSGFPDLNYLGSTSSTMTKNNRLNTEPWCNPNWTRKSLKVWLTLTQLRAFLYINCTILTSHYSTPCFLKAHHTTTSLGTQTKAFSKSKNAKCKFCFLPKYFSCHCLKINKYGSCGSVSWHTTKQHLINVHPKNDLLGLIYWGPNIFVSRFSQMKKMH